MALGGFAPCPFPLGGTAVDGFVAEQHARLSADLKAAVSAAPFALIRFATDNTTPLAYIAQHGVGVSAAPTLTVLGVGDIELLWAASYQDEYDNAWGSNITQAVATAHQAFGYTTNCVAVVTLVSSRQIRVRTRNPVTGAGDAVVSLAVW